MTRKVSVTSFLRRATRQYGMSMTEMAITMGLIGFAALGAASLSGNMASGSKKIQGMVALNSYASSLNAHLYSSLGCEALKSMGSLSSTPKEVVLTGWTYQGINRWEGGKDSSGKKKTPTRNFDIESLQASLETPANAVTITDASNVVLTKSVLKFKAILMVGNKPSEYVYNIPVLISPSGNVTYCSEEKNVAETCAAAQGKYNPATKSCDLGSTCKVKDTWNRLTCRAIDELSKSGWSCSPIFGASKVNQYTGDFSCPDGSVETETQNTTWVSQRDCGKKCTQSIQNNMVWKICLECPTP